MEMEFGVFGIPITEETLKGKPEYEGKEITRDDLAKEPLRTRNLQGDKVIYPPWEVPYTIIYAYNTRLELLTSTQLVRKDPICA